MAPGSHTATLAAPPAGAQAASSRSRRSTSATQGFHPASCAGCPALSSYTRVASVLAAAKVATTKSAAGAETTTFVAMGTSRVISCAGSQSSPSNGPRAASALVGEERILVSNPTAASCSAHCSESAKGTNFGIPPRKHCSSTSIWSSPTTQAVRDGQVHSFAQEYSIFISANGGHKAQYNTSRSYSPSTAVPVVESITPAELYPK
mmetsp:Transcript_82107/g.219743  ORF Transcript_82107/g.219743 Transcript_82107/m.219743 type:complete len:206 (-) Transcript_82107:1699-2316(-)